MKKYQKYMNIAQQVANMSKDPSTKVGAIAIDDEYAILSTGYNGFPRHIPDDPEHLNNKQEKYKRIIHAEANLVAQAARNGVSLKNSTVLLTGMHPCTQCAGLLIQVGVKQIIVDGKHDDAWNTTLSSEMLQQAGIPLININQGNRR